MSHERSLADCRAEIDSHLETALEAANSDSLAAAQAAVRESDDRLYGQLLVLSYDSMVDTSDTESILSAATAVELLRGYCRLRSELLVQVNDEVAHSLNRDPTAALLAGDYLYTSAYSALGAVDNAHLGDCFETLMTVSETIIEAFYTTDTESTSPATGQCSFIDETAGILGQGAAVIGATLAGVDRDRRAHFAALGRGLSTGHQIRLSLESDAGTAHIMPRIPDEQRLRQHAERRLEEANQALRGLSSVTDMNRLRTLFEDIEGYDG